MKTSGLITLLTDFGEQDGYVGTIKGIILGIFPGARVIDISHAIEPGNIDAAAFVLHTSACYFPPGTVHLVVVDPGVGSNRRPIACQAGNHYFVAPDNGVLKYILSGEKNFQVYHLSRPGFFLARISNTFHGRDIFAPVAAYLAAGVKIAQMGDLIHDFLLAAPAEPVLTEDEISGQVIYVDRFGNLITSISEKNILGSIHKNKFVIHVKGQKIPGLSFSYSDVTTGALVALIGSSGYLEIAVREGNAAHQLNAGPGTVIHIKW